MNTRRDFLLALGAGAMLPALARAARTPGGPGHEASALPDDRARNPLRTVGIQLYMLRAAMRADPEATVARIATLGYGQIEWWGSWGRTPAQLRAMLDADGLTAPSAHIDPHDLEPERLPALLDAAATMGHKTVLVAWTAPEQRKTADDWKRLGALLTSAGTEAARVGIRAGYHNHDFEFVRFGDRTALEILLAESDPRVVDLELDCYWAFRAGLDPHALLERHADRITMLHLKDASSAPSHEQVDLGTGVIPWRPLLATAARQRVTNVYVEMDDPADAWASARVGREYLRTIGY
jgi:sugar phosphate isomerase/epimerase